MNFERHYHRVLKTRQKPVRKPFEDQVQRYDEWYDRHTYVYLSELAILNHLLPKDGTGIQVGVATGRFADLLGIKEGVEPSAPMREVAWARGIDVMDGKAEHLPYSDMRYDFVLMATLSYLDDVPKAFREAHRVLKRKGQLIVGFIERDSDIGNEYLNRKGKEGFYQSANFYTVREVLEMLKASNFKLDVMNQTLFGTLNSIKELQPFKEGHGQGSFIALRAVKN